MPSGLSRTTSASTPEAAVAVARLLDKICALGHFGSTTIAMRMWLSAWPVPGGPRPGSAVSGRGCVLVDQSSKDPSTTDSAQNWVVSGWCCGAPQPHAAVRGAQRPWWRLSRSITADAAIRRRSCPTIEDRPSPLVSRSTAGCEPHRTGVVERRPTAGHQRRRRLLLDQGPGTCPPAAAPATAWPSPGTPTPRPPVASASPAQDTSTAHPKPPLQERQYETAVPILKCRSSSSGRR